jgi:hypothetical protein
MKLHAWLAESGKTASWLAEKTGLSAGYVSRIGRDGVPKRIPSLETCAKIASATDGMVTAIDFVPPTAPRAKAKKRRPKKTKELPTAAGH